MTGWIVAGITALPLGFLLLHYIKLATKLKTENENLQANSSRKDKQIDIASRPTASPDSVLKRLREDGSL